MESQRAVLDVVIAIFEAAGVGVMAIGGAFVLFSFLAAVAARQDLGVAYTGVRRQLERAIVLGVELLIVGDIILSVALEPSYSSIGTLALLILIRTFLS